MAISVDNTSESSGNVGTTLTYSHTVTGSQLFLVVTAAVNGSAPSGVTYNGVAMTIRATADSGGNTASVWTLANPATGANNVVLTKGNNLDIASGAVSYKGADTSGIGGTNSADGISTTASTVVTVTGDVGFVTDCVWTGGPSPSVGAGQTRFMNQPDYGAGTRDAASSYESHTGSNVTMSWSLTSDAWAIAAVEIKEGAATFKPKVMIF